MTDMLPLGPLTAPMTFEQERLEATREFGHLVRAATTLFDAAHQAALQKLLRATGERVTPLDTYVQTEEPTCYLTLRRYGGCAFTHETIFDLKHHATATEIFLVLRGRLRIGWKHRDATRFQSLELDALQRPWGLLPPEHCLLVTPADAAGFLALVFKTTPSTIRQGKQLGIDCPITSCPHKKACEALQTNRISFFQSLAGAREPEDTERARRIASEKWRSVVATLS